MDTQNTRPHTRYLNAAYYNQKGLVCYVPLSRGANYTDETKRSLEMRLKEHERNIQKKEENLNLAQHIKMCKFETKKEGIKILEKE